MTDQFPPQQPGGVGNPKADRAAAKAYAKAQRPWYKKKRILLPLALFAIIGISVASSGGGGSNTVTTADDGAVTETEAPTAKAPVVKAPVVKAPVVKAPVAKAPAKPAETSGQRNAKEAAENYLSFTAFSRVGLIQQLSSDAGDGYSVADATYGVDAQDVDYKEQAYKAAKNYLDLTAFSRQGLIEQLSSAAGDKYTVAEATFGADKALAE